MKKLIIASFMAASIISGGSANASITVVDFEGIYDWDLVDGYGGLSNWGGSKQLMDNLMFPNPQPDLGVNHLTIWSAGLELNFDSAPVVFEGMYYQPVGLDGSVSYELYFHGQLVFSAPFDPSQPYNENMYWLTSAYRGLVDKIHIYGASDGVNIDNLSYSTVAAVPLPGAAWLFGSSLTGLVWRGRRERRG